MVTGVYLLSFKYYKPRFLMSFIILLIAVHSFIISLWNFIPPWIPAISSSVFIFSIIIIYDKYLWKKIPLLLKVTNISGRYKGELISNYSTKTKLDVVIEITQTSSHIFIRQFNNKNGEITKSYSNNEDIELQKDGTFKISFAFKNDGVEVSSSINEHKGFCILQTNKNKKVLEGVYFTNRDPATKGQIKVEYQSSKLLGEYGDNNE